jgi:flagellin-like protein
MIQYRIRTPYIRTTPKGNLLNDFTQLLNEMRRHRSRSAGLSPLVAVILLIAITVAAAVVVSGVFFNLAGIAGRRPTAAIDQVRLIASPTPSAAYAATFVIVLKNTGDVPILGNPTVTLTYGGVACTTGAFAWGGNFNPGGTISGTATITGAGCTLLGRTVTVTVTVDFADGSRQILTTAVTGTLA